MSHPIIKNRDLTVDAITKRIVISQVILVDAEPYAKDVELAIKGEIFQWDDPIYYEKTLNDLQMLAINITANIEKWHTINKSLFPKWFRNYESLQISYEQKGFKGFAPIRKTGDSLNDAARQITAQIQILFEYKGYLESLLESIELGAYDDDHTTKEKSPAHNIDILMKIIRNFPKYELSLFTKPHAKSELKIAGLKIQNEYDLQHLVYPLISSVFDNVQEEIPGPGIAGRGNRVDFVLKNDSIALEVKVAKSGKSLTDLRDELLADVLHYKGFKHVVFFIYDIDNVIQDRTVFEHDVSHKALEIGLESTVTTIVEYQRIK